MKSIVAIGAVLVVIASASIAGGTPQDARKAGKEFYTREVLPRLAENGCPLCHAVYYVRPRVMEYEELLPYLAMGESADGTAVIRKIANLRAFAPDRPTHPGGQRCKSLDSEPCKTIMRWWEIEFGRSQN